ncbi:MAG: homoserine dehydrogenase [Bacillota bacterium]
MSVEKVALGLLGMGTVGTGVLRLLEQNGSLMAERQGVSLWIKRALVRDPARPRPGIPAGILTSDPRLVLDDPEIRVIVEVMGGTSPAREHVTAALRAGKAVVTANKELVADYGRELYRAADQGGSGLFFEASVGGGIPILGPLKQSLAANRVGRLAGILNGTSNYILTRMSEAGLGFAEALQEAQAEGYAEADPSADVEGHDTARKLAILASIAFGTRVTSRDIRVDGITGVGHADIVYGQELGWEVKLLGRAEVHPGGLWLRVGPTFVPREHPLAGVRGVYNAIMVHADAAGTLMFYGRGAGAGPTASAVVGDVLEALRQAGGRANGCTCRGTASMAGPDQVAGRYYLRLEVTDRPGVLSEVAGVMAAHGISLHSVIQKRLTQAGAELVFVTHEAPEGQVRAAAARLSRLDTVHRVAAVLSVGIS